MPNSLKLDGTATVPLRLRTTNGATEITSSNPIETKLKDMLVAAFQAIPNQSGGTATVAAIVTALKTLP